jgi:hypothetical protein
MVGASIMLLVGFASGYGVRELISRRRHAAARKRFYEKLETGEIRSQIA